MQKRRRTYSDSECKAETEYLRTARKGGGHKGKFTLMDFNNVVDT